MNRLLVAATLSAAVVAVAACSSGEPGVAQPTNPGDTMSRSSTPTGDGDNASPGYGAPSVENPLDLGHFLQNPCDGLTDAQVTEFFGAGNKSHADADGTVGPECTWAKDRVVNGGIHLTFPTIGDGGISDVYRNRETYGLFSELEPADGYPVVAHGAVDKTGSGECAVSVGTSDQATFTVSLVLGQDRVGSIDPCTAAREVAVAVIENIETRN